MVTVSAIADALNASDASRLTAAARPSGRGRTDLAAPVRGPRRQMRFTSFSFLERAFPYGPHPPLRLPPSCDREVNAL